MNETRAVPEKKDENGSTAIDGRTRVLRELETEIQRAGGDWEEDSAFQGAIGRTMFDLPNAEDNLVAVIVPRDSSHTLPSQTLVEIRSRSDGDGRSYQGIVVEGPFYVPNGMRADADPIVIMTAKGKAFLPDYHGRTYVEILAELEDGALLPPRHRPLPNSPVFALGEAETKEALRIEGDITLGLAIGHDALEVRFSSKKKAVLPRHTAILGTTGGGKSTTVANQVREQQRAGLATILIDTEGEYTCLNEPTDHQPMLEALRRRGMKAAGVENTRVYHLVGRETSNPSHPDLVPFTLRFDQLSPYAVAEILGMNEAQEERFWKAYEIARDLMQKKEICPENYKNRDSLIEIDEMERGFPNLTLAMMYDIVQACKLQVQGELTNDKGEPNFFVRSAELRNQRKLFLAAIPRGPSLPKNYLSWGKVQGQLGRLLRLGIFDNAAANPIDYEDLTGPGRVSIIDLGDTDSPQVNNLVIAELLRSVLERQNETYQRMREREDDQQRVVIMIEETHEFLSAARVRQMPALFEQVARIAKRGRKRWLGLTFITQLPQHLPDEVLGLVNNYILHKITDGAVITRLKKSAGGIDEGLWKRLPALAEGQAIVKMESMARPLLVAMDPAPSRLLMVE